MGKRMFILSIFLDVSRIMLGLYSIYIRQMVKKEDYKAQCDINDYVSCSKSLASEYGAGFGLIGPLFGVDHPLNLPNGVFGTTFFTMHLLLLLFMRSPLGLKLRVANSIMLNVGCGWLAYILFFVIKHICLVCIPMYVLNFFSLVVDILVLRWHSAAAAVKADRKKKN